MFFPRLGIIFALALVSSSVQADSFDCKGQAAVSDPQSIVRQVQDRYSATPTFHARFLQNSFLAALETAESSSGDVWFAKPGQMKWHYEKPEEQVFILKDETLWLHYIHDKQVLIDNLKTITLSELPVSFLLGLGDLSKDFKVTESCRNPNGIVLNLVPATRNPQDDSLESLTLLVDPVSYLPRGAAVNDVAGNRTAILLNQMDTKTKPSEATFATNFPKGTDIDDRRGIVQ